MEGSFIQLTNGTEYKLHWFADSTGSKTHPVITFQLVAQMSLLEAVTKFSNLDKFTYIIRHDRGKDLTAEFTGFTEIETVSLVEGCPLITLKQSTL